MGRWKAGTTVGDHRIVIQLGSGGMCEVYEAWHERLQARHAIKCLNAEHLSNAAARNKFELEASSLWQISQTCPHVVKVFNATGTNDPYIVMELLRGEDLQRWGRRYDRGMSPANAVTVLEHTALALEAAHANRTVHRDIKPGNIFLEQGEQGPMVKVIDFGIAKVLGDSTGSSLQAGTQNYMAPEQLLGRAVPQSDVFALGLIGFFTLTASDFWQSGESRFDQPDLSPLDRARELHWRGELECSSPDEALPPGFERWFRRCTMRQPADRFESAKQAAAEFRALFLPEQLALPTLATQTDLTPLVLPDAPGTTSATDTAVVSTSRSVAATAHFPLLRKVAPRPTAATGATLGGLARSLRSRLRGSRRLWAWGISASAATGLALLIGVSVVPQEASDSRSDGPILAEPVERHRASLPVPPARGRALPAKAANHTPGGTQQAEPVERHPASLPVFPAEGRALSAKSANRTPEAPPRVEHFERHSTPLTRHDPPSPKPTSPPLGAAAMPAKPARRLQPLAPSLERGGRGHKARAKKGANPAEPLPTAPQAPRL